MRTHLRATDLYAVGSFDPDHDAIMRIGGEAPGGGPILSVGISARFEYGFPPPRIVNSAVVLKAPARAPKMVVSGMLLSGRWTYDDTLQWFASSDKAPERNDQFACQRDDHGLARATTAVGGAGAIP
jgi:hypothetical protein